MFTLVEERKTLDTLVQSKSSSTVSITREIHDALLEEAIKEGIQESKLSKKEKKKIESLGLRFKGPTYLEKTDCNCGRQLNSYDFLMTGVYHHGIERIREIFNSGSIVTQVNPSIDHIVCSSCFRKVAFRAPTSSLQSTSKRYFWTLLYACVETSSGIQAGGDMIARLERRVRKLERG